MIRPSTGRNALISVSTVSVDLVFVVVQDLAFHERVHASCIAASVLQRVAEKNDAMRVAIGRMIKYNIPRFLRLTDVNINVSSGAKGSQGINGTDDNYCNVLFSHNWQLTD